MVSNIGVDCSKSGTVAAGMGCVTKWCPPVPGWIKVNVVGVAGTDESWLAAAGVLHDSHGNWVIGYQRFLGRGSTLNSELWVILHGLQIAEIKGHDKVFIESDCLVALKMIKDCFDGAPSKTIVQKIKEVTMHFEAFKVQFVQRESNLVANYLAKTCESTIIDIRIIDSPSTCVRKLLLDDYTVGFNA